MTREFWQRKVIVNFEPKKGNAFSVSDLRITFNIQKRSGIEPNPGKIVVYNMNPKHRDVLAWRFDISRQAYGGTVEVIAGYGDHPKQIFKGDIVQAINTKVGPDWMTTIEAMTGIEALSTGTVNKTFPAGTDNQSILKYLIDQVDVKSIKAEITTFASEVLGRSKTKKPQTLVGSVTDMIDALNKKFEGKLSVSIDERGIKVTPPGVANTDRPFVLSQSSGLLETPEITPVGCNFKALLIPELRSGSPVILRSKSIESLKTGGDYVVEKVTFTGDNREGEFVTNAISLFPVQNITPVQ
jgi:hypothetical protein